MATGSTWSRRVAIRMRGKPLQHRRRGRWLANERRDAFEQHPIGGRFAEDVFFVVLVVAMAMVVAMRMMMVMAMATVPRIAGGRQLRSTTAGMIAMTAVVAATAASSLEKRRRRLQHGHRGRRLVMRLMMVAIGR